MNDGGPAFPNVTPDEIVNGRFQTAMPGMSLRDWFAGQFASQLIGNSASMGTIHQTAKAKGHEDIEAVVAMVAYKFADAMLAESAKGGQ